MTAADIFANLNRSLEMALEVCDLQRSASLQHPHGQVGADNVLAGISDAF